MPSTKTTFDLQITEDQECFNTGQGWWHCSGCVVRCELETSRQHPLYRTLKAAIKTPGDSDITVAETLTTLLAEAIIETDHFAGEIDDLEGHIDELVRKILCVDRLRTEQYKQREENK